MCYSESLPLPLRFPELNTPPQSRKSSVQKEGNHSQAVQDQDRNKDTSSPGPMTSFLYKHWNNNCFFELSEQLSIATLDVHIIVALLPCSSQEP